MQYFTILLKENSSENHKLLTEKLNEGYYVDEKVQVGRSTTLILRARVAEAIASGARYSENQEPMTSSGI